MFSKSFDWYDITYLLTSICFHTGWVGSIHQKLDKKLKMDSLWYLKLRYSEYMTSIKFPGSLSSPIRVLEAQTVKMRSQHRTLCKNKCIFETCRSMIEIISDFHLNWTVLLSPYSLLNHKEMWKCFFRFLQSPVLLIW